MSGQSGSGHSRPHHTTPHHRSWAGGGLWSVSRPPGSLLTESSSACGRVQRTTKIINGQAAEVRYPALVSVSVCVTPGRGVPLDGRGRGHRVPGSQLWRGRGLRSVRPDCRPLLCRVSRLLNMHRQPSLQSLENLRTISKSISEITTGWWLERRITSGEPSARSS